MAGEALSKVCTKCKEDKPLSEFCKHGNGLYPSCRACNKAYKQANAERIRAYRLARREEEYAVNRAWAAKNKEKIARDARRYRAENAEKIKEYHRKWAKDNPEKRAAYAAKWLQKFKVRDAPAKREYRKANRERYRQLSAEWRRKNPEKLKASYSACRARRRGAEGHYTADDVDRIRKAQRDRCACCRVSLNGGGQIDHIQAIAKGGTNWPSNLQLLCAPCNRAKWDKDQIDFMQERGFLL